MLVGESKVTVLDDEAQARVVDRDGALRAHHLSSLPHSSYSSLRQGAMRSYEILRKR